MVTSSLTTLTAIRWSKPRVNAGITKIKAKKYYRTRGMQIFSIVDIPPRPDSEDIPVDIIQMIVEMTQQ